MQLPVNPPILPMLSKRIDKLPESGNWIFEPKWDGFRALIFRDGDEILIQSRDGKSLNRYFPELLKPIEAQLPARCVLDGEIVIATNRGLEFETLQLRIHPAASRVKLLSQQSPASIVFFDLLCVGDRDLCGIPFQSRRQELESLLSSAIPPLHLTPATYETSVAEDWFRRFEGAGLDGVMAKPVSGTYEPDKRVMLKVKHERDCDCVVGGFRWHKKVRAPLSARSCLACSTIPGRCSTLEFAPASQWRNGVSWWSSWLPSGRTLSQIIRGRAGLRPESVKPDIAFQEARAAGAKAKTCPGSRCVPSL